MFDSIRLIACLTRFSFCESQVDELKADNAKKAKALEAEANKFKDLEAQVHSLSDKLSRVERVCTVTDYDCSFVSSDSVFHFVLITISWNFGSQLGERGSEVALA